MVLDGVDGPVALFERYLEQARFEQDGCEVVARPEGQTSNSLLDTLAEWNVYLDSAWGRLVGHQAPQTPFEVHLTV